MSYDWSGSIDVLLKQRSGIRLDLGCGNHKEPGFVGLDSRPLLDVDIVWDVENMPWPLPDESCVILKASHLVEHIDPHGGGFLRFMDEAWRVLQLGGQFAISCPHGASPGYLQDPTHCNALNEATWSYFTPDHALWLIYAPRPWAIEHLSWSAAANMEVVLRKVAESDADESEVAE